jgi:hypothetical protein
MVALCADIDTPLLQVGISSVSAMLQSAFALKLIGGLGAATRHGDDARPHIPRAAAISHVGRIFEDAIDPAPDGLKFGAAGRSRTLESARRRFGRKRIEGNQVLVDGEVRASESRQLNLNSGPSASPRQAALGCRSRRYC